MACNVRLHDVNLQALDKWATVSHFAQAYLLVVNFFLAVSEAQENRPTRKGVSLYLVQSCTSPSPITLLTAKPIFSPPPKLKRLHSDHTA